jgi:hypothetical protein
LRLTGRSFLLRRRASGFFGFTVSLPGNFLLWPHDDSLLFEPPEPFHVHFRGDCTAAIRLLGQSLFFDGRRVVFRAGLGVQSSIGRDGAFCTRRGGVVTVVGRDGRNGRWSSFDRGGRHDESPLLFTQEFATKRQRMIGRDRIEYSICRDGTRMIFHREDFSIVESAESIATGVPGFPSQRGGRAGTLSLGVGPLTFTCGEGVTGVTSRNTFPSPFCVHSLSRISRAEMR